MAVPLADALLKAKTTLENVDTTLKGKDYKGVLDQGQFTRPILVDALFSLKSSMQQLITAVDTKN